MSLSPGLGSQAFRTSPPVTLSKLNSTARLSAHQLFHPSLLAHTVSLTVPVSLSPAMIQTSVNQNSTELVVSGSLL